MMPERLRAIPMRVASAIEMLTNERSNIFDDDEEEANNGEMKRPNHRFEIKQMMNK